MRMHDGSSTGFLGLGRVCCQRRCECEYVFRETFSNVETRPNEPITLVQPPLSLGYECTNELSDCMSYCRRSAFALISSTNAGFETDDTLPSLDVFEQSEEFKKYLCRLISKDEELGFNVFYRYIQGDVHPYKEDLHIGRLCCRPFFGSFLGFNRCEDP